MDYKAYYSGPKKPLGFQIFLFVLVFSTVFFLALSADAHQFTLKSGEVVSGEIKDKEVSFQSNYGKVMIGSETIESFADNQLKLRDGSALKGSFTGAILKVKTTFGILDLKSEEIVSMMPAAESPPFFFQITIKENQTVTGKLTQDTLPFVTGIGVVNPPIDDIVSLHAGRLRLTDGSALHGVLQQEKLVVETKYGMVELDRKDIVSISKLYLSRGELVP
jgi:hypothetical protein